MFGARYFGQRYFGGAYFGHSGLSTPGYYNGSRYFGNRYFGARYFGSNVNDMPFEVEVTSGISLTGTLQTTSGPAFGTDFEVTQTNTIALVGALLANSSPAFNNDDWSVTAPVEVSTLTGTLTVTASILIEASAAGYGSYWGRRYFGARYFGPRYFGAPDTFDASPTNTISLSGTLGVAGNIATAIGITPTAPIALTGTLGVAGDASFQLSTTSSTGAVMYFRPYAWVNHPSYATDAVIYLQPRLIAGVYTSGISGAQNPNSAATMPSAYHPLGRVRQDGTIMIDPAWDRFLRYQWEARLGGIDGPAVPDVAQTVVVAQQSAAQSSAEVSALSIQTQANAESLAVVVQVTQNSDLPGSEQIPPVRLSPGENIP